MGGYHFEVGGLKKTLPLNMVSVEYSSDLAQELGIGARLDEGKSKLSQLLGFQI
jgi:hypothetical protein